MPPTRRRTSGRRNGTSTRHSHLTQSSLSSGHFVFSFFYFRPRQPNPTHQINGRARATETQTRTNRHFAHSSSHTHTDQDPITHLTSSQLTDPCPYQDNRILPNLANVPPSLIPFRPCKRPDHVWPSSQGSHTSPSITRALQAQTAGPKEKFMGQQASYPASQHSKFLVD